MKPLGWDQFNLTGVLRRIGDESTKRHQGYKHTEETPCEEAVREQLSTSQGERPQEKSSFLAP